MKRFFTISISILLPFFIAAQVVTTTPAFVTTDYSGAVTIIFDATPGNKGLKAEICIGHCLANFISSQHCERFKSMQNQRHILILFKVSILDIVNSVY
jgi:hypothetical protein